MLFFCPTLMFHQLNKLTYFFSLLIYIYVVKKNMILYLLDKIASLNLNQKMQKGFPAAAVGQTANQPYPRHKIGPK